MGPCFYIYILNHVIFEKHIESHKFEKNGEETLFVDRLHEEFLVDSQLI